MTSLVANTAEQSMGIKDDKAEVSPPASSVNAAPTAGGVTAPGVPNNPARTPTPWRVDTNMGGCVVAMKGGLIATCDDGNYFTNPGDGPINAAFIVLACNSFDALTEANKKLQEEREELIASALSLAERGKIIWNALEKCAADCSGCNGKGEIGGFEMCGSSPNEGSGYVSEPCPDCEHIYAALKAAKGAA